MYKDTDFQVNVIEPSEQIAASTNPGQIAIMTLEMVASAYLAEVFRTALAAVPRHQWQSAEALGLNRVDTYLRVILPQAARIAAAPVAGIRGSDVSGHLARVRAAHFGTAQSGICDRIGAL